ncbi:MAG: hypothetical protein ACE5LS_00735 [Thermoplasmata archaeon]
MAPTRSAKGDPRREEGAISSELAVIALTLITVALAVLVYFFAITFL